MSTGVVHCFSAFCTLAVLFVLLDCGMQERPWRTAERRPFCGACGCVHCAPCSSSSNSYSIPSIYGNRLRACNLGAAGRVTAVSQAYGCYVKPVILSLSPFSAGTSFACTGERRGSLWACCCAWFRGLPLKDGHYLRYRYRTLAKAHGGGRRTTDDGQGRMLSGGALCLARRRRALWRG